MSFTEAARRAQIVDCAIAVLAEFGYSRASLARIAERAGVSKSAIPYYFGGKDELMRQVVIDVYTKGAQFIIPCIQAESTARGMLRASIEANIEYIAEHREAIVAATEVISNLRKPDGTLYFDAAADEVNVEGIVWILNNGQKDGEFREFDTRVLAMTIRAAIDRAAQHLATGREPDWKTYADELTAAFDRATRSSKLSLENKDATEQGE
nr:putative TetR/AcrR family transcriptional regulator [uncultured bacterium]